MPLFHILTLGKPLNRTYQIRFFKPSENGSARAKVECRCGSTQVQRYRQRTSGPLLDRIDLHIEVPAVEYRDISSTRAEENSVLIR